jgi:hypothetical protein
VGSTEVIEKKQKMNNNSGGNGLSEESFSTKPIEIQSEI